jgi:hypothetical protein
VGAFGLHSVSPPEHVTREDRWVSPRISEGVLEEKRFHDRVAKASGSSARVAGRGGIPWETISYEVSAKNSRSAPKRQRFHWKRFRAIVAEQVMRARIVFWDLVASSGDAGGRRYPVPPRLTLLP